MSNWEHTKKAAEDMIKAKVRADEVLDGKYPVFDSYVGAQNYILSENLSMVTVEELTNEQGHSIYVIVDKPKLMTFGDAMAKISPTESAQILKDIVENDYGFLGRKEQAQAASLKETIAKSMTPLSDAMEQFDGYGNAIDHETYKVRQSFMSFLANLSVEDARHINPDTLINATLAYCDNEALMAGVFTKMNRQPTMNAVRRTIDFMLSTTSVLTDLFDDDDDDYISSPKDKKPYQKNMDDMLAELNNLIFVSKARVIMDDYPESISLSVQLLPSISEDETGNAMMRFESILQDHKPKNLIELEVSITNKVVY